MLSLSVAAKLLLFHPADAVPPLARLGGFLSAARVQDLRPIHGMAASYQQGWAFRIGGCSGRAFPQALGGEDEVRVRGLAGPSEEVAYILDGAPTSHPPDAAQRARLVFRRIGHAFAGRAEPTAIAVLQSPACRVTDKLPWRRL